MRNELGTGRLGFQIPNGTSGINGRRANQGRIRLVPIKGRQGRTVLGCFVVVEEALLFGHDILAATARVGRIVVNAPNAQVITRGGQ